MTAIVSRELGAATAATAARRNWVASAANILPLSPCTKLPATSAIFGSEFRIFSRRGSFWRIKSTRDGGGFSGG